MNIIMSKEKISGDILCIDKPTGISSFDVIRILRKKLGLRKMGHAGTLDPLATGLLVIGIGAGTKKLKEMIGLSKVYEAEVLIGVRTATGDLEGRVEEEKDASGLTEADIRNALEKMTGTLTLPVPKYSAVKVKGMPLYRAARRGELVVPPKKEMSVTDTLVREVCFEGKTVVVAVRWSVSSGTYIRSLAEELGTRLGVPATLKSLRRTRVGELRVEDALLLDEVG